MTLSIAGKSAIVTGAANGVGLAIARHFVEQGARVMFADRDEKKLEAEVQAISSADSECRYFAGDLREKLTLANLLSATLDEFDQVDILVNASRQMLTSDPLDPDADAYDILMEQNLTTSLRLSQIVARRMIKQAEGQEDHDGSIGSIVNLTSIAATRAQPDLLAFSISAAALEQMTRSMAVALAKYRIRVNAVAIGSVMSASLRDAFKENSDLRQMVSNATPLGRIGEAAEVAEAVQYLASDSASFVTGQVLNVDGGRGLLDSVAVSAH